MKYGTLALAIAIILLAGVLYVGNQNASLGGVYTSSIPRFSTASSTAYSPGHQLSIEVLQNRPSRWYASFCASTAANPVYLVFSSTAVTATTSAGVQIDAGECYEIDQDNRYTGEVQVITEVATTTNTFIVTELIGSN